MRTKRAKVSYPAPPVVTAEPVSDVVSAALQAYDVGWEIEEYLAAVNLGITDAEITWATEGLSIPMDWYVSARAAGATNAELLECRQTERIRPSYLKSRQLGSTHDQYVCASSALADSLGTSRGISAYIYCLEAGATHAQALQAYEFGYQLDEYASLRAQGLDHDRALNTLEWLANPPAGY
jgi:hypothetical protein